VDLSIGPFLFLWNIIFTFYYTRVGPQCDYVAITPFLGGHKICWNTFFIREAILKKEKESTIGRMTGIPTCTQTLYIKHICLFICTSLQKLFKKTTRGMVLPFAPHSAPTSLCPNVPKKKTHHQRTHSEEHKEEQIWELFLHCHLYPSLPRC